MARFARLMAALILLRNLRLKLKSCQYPNSIKEALRRIDSLSVLEFT